MSDARSQPLGAAVTVGRAEGMDRETTQPRTPAVVGLVATIAVLVSCIAATGWVTTDTALEYVRLAYLVANLLATLAVISDPQRGALALMVSYFFLLFVAVPANVQVALMTFPFGSVYNGSQILAGYSLLIVFQLAYLVTLIPRTAAHGNTISGTQAKYEFSLFESPSAIVFAWLITSALLATAVFVGPNELFTPRFDDDLNADGSTGSLSRQLVMAGRAISLLVLLVLLWRRRKRRQTGSPRITRSENLLAVIAGAVFLAFNYPPGLPRFQLLGAGIALALIYFDLFRLKAKATVVVVATVFLFAVFGQLKTLAGANPSSRAMPISEYLVRVDFDAFKQVIDTQLFLSQGGEPRQFQSLIGMLLFWVPRSIWPGKPEPAGAVVSGQLGYAYTNVSSPLPAEALLAFGELAVVATGILVGWLIVRAERKARSGGATTSSYIFYVIAAGFATIVLRGSLNGVAPMFLAAFFVYAGLVATDRVHYEVRTSGRSPQHPDR